MPHAKLTPVASLVLLVLICAATLPASPPGVGAEVQSWHLDPATNLVTLKIVNTSHKDITAYSITIKETYADGHVDSFEHLADFVGMLAVLKEFQGTVDEDRMRKTFGDGLFHPGETRDEIIGVQPNLMTFQAVVDVVTYVDRSSDATNSDALQRIVDHRKTDVASTQLANDIIKTALADSNDPDPAATAASKIRDRIKVWKAQTHTTTDFGDLETGTLQGVVEDLERVSHSTNKRDALNQYVAQREQHITTLSPHAELTKTGGPQ